VAVSPADYRRNVLVDAIRGACFAFMTLDHFPGNPVSRLSNANYGPFGFFTAALGFVFISGLVAGWVYEGRRVRTGARLMTLSALRRVRALYVTQMALCVGLAVAVALNLRGVDRWHLDAFESSPWRGLVLSGSLLYEPGYLGILPMYCLFLTVTPVLIWQFARGNLAPVLCVSVTLWVTAGFLIRPPSDPNGVDFGAFNPLSYQLLFIVGLAFGTRALDLRRLSARTQRRLTYAAALIAAVFLVLRQAYALNGPLNPALDKIGALFSAVQLGPLRLLNFAAFALVLFAVLHAVEWSEVKLSVFRWLAFVGRNSLPVFAWSIMITYVGRALFPATATLGVEILAAAAAVASLTIPAWIRSRFRRHQERRMSRGLRVPPVAEAQLPKADPRLGKALTALAGTVDAGKSGDA
jgi:hypothetical protein